MVEDAQVYAMNHEWFNNLPDDLQDSVRTAAEKTFRQNLEQVPVSRQNAYDELEGAGATIHSLSDDEIGAWRDAMGHQRSEWDDWKTDLAGDMETFERLEAASQEQSDYTVEEP